MLSNKYIDLTTNGKLFPSWILKNFEKYYIPELKKKDGEDPCKDPTRIRLYQEFLVKYMDFRSPYKSILVYHGMGSGKTVTAINIYNSLYNYTSNWNVFIILKATLKNQPWMTDLQKFLKDDEKNYRMKNITFISYDSPIADKQFLDAMKSADVSKKNLFIIEECHEFIKNVYSNIQNRQGRRAQVIYDYIIQDKIENDQTRIICLSATPAINNPFELALLFNLLRPNTFPKSESLFNQLFQTSSTYPVINPLNKNLFQRRIMGLVSYYAGATPDKYASKTIHQVDVVMSEYQQDIYNYFEEQEKAMDKKKRENKGGSESYKTFTRQASNFVFPPLGQNMTGETRPRPSKFKLSEKDDISLLRGKELDSIDPKAIKRDNILKYQKLLKDYINAFEDYVDKKISDKRSIMDDYAEYEKLNYDFNKFIESKTPKSKVFEALYNSSAKITLMCFIIQRSKGPVLIYSNYVYMEGIEIIKKYLKYFGFGDIKSNAKFKYVEYHGGVSKEDRRKYVDMYNEYDNRYGKNVKICFVSPSGSAGVSFKNTRQMHITEPYWHEVRITQMIGRAIRDCYHVDLPMDERHVDIYRYKSIRKNNKNKTTDQYIENLAKTKQNLIDSFLNAVKQVAVDCELFKNVNMLNEQYKCFKFDQTSLFEKQIGPAYKEDIKDDIKMNNGLNSTDSYIERIKVKKIKGVKLLTQPNEEPKYSKSKSYLYDPDSHVVYDPELHYAIGKVGLDDDNLAMKIDNETYIITHVIPIPSIN